MASFIIAPHRVPNFQRVGCASLSSRAPSTAHAGLSRQSCLSIAASQPRHPRLVCSPLPAATSVGTKWMINNTGCHCACGRAAPARNEFGVTGSLRYLSAPCCLSCVCRAPAAASELSCSAALCTRIHLAFSVSPRKSSPPLVPDGSLGALVPQNWSSLLTVWPSCASSAGFILGSEHDLLFILQPTAF